MFLLLLELPELRTLNLWRPEDATLMGFIDRLVASPELCPKLESLELSVLEERAPMGSERLSPIDRVRLLKRIVDFIEMRWRSQPLQNLGYSKLENADIRLSSTMGPGHNRSAATDPTSHGLIQRLETCRAEKRTSACIGTQRNLGEAHLDH